MTPLGEADRATSHPQGADAPDPETTATVTRIAEGVLRRDDPPSDQDLFDLGATSLAFVRIIAEVNERFGIALTGAELGDVASIDRIAVVVRSAVDTAVTGAV